MQVLPTGLADYLTIYKIADKIVKANMRCISNIREKNSQTDKLLLAKTVHKSPHLDSTTR